MNFKKTLGLVLTAALVSSSLVAVRPAKAAPTTATPVVATAPNQAQLTNFSYFYAERSLLVDGEANTYVVDTDYAGKVQYELWIQDTADKSGKWQVISKGADGKPGYTEATDGKNSPYKIPVVDGFTFKEGSYNVAVYAKVAGTAGTQTRGHYIDATTGIDTDSKSGIEQKYDILKVGRFRAENKSYKAKYNEMLGDFIFNPQTFTVNKKVTFSGFAGQKDGAKYKFLVRKLGADYSTQTAINDTYASTVDWTPTDAGTYEVIAWSEPNVNKGAGLDGWRIGYVTVNTATPTSKLTVSKATFSPFIGQELVTVNDASLVSKVIADGTEVKFSKLNDTTVKFAADNEPKTLVLEDADGNKVDALGGNQPQPTDDTLTASKATFSPFIGQELVTVNKADLVAKVISNGTEVKFSKLNDTTIKFAADDEPTSLVLEDAKGNQVTVK